MPLPEVGQTVPDFALSPYDDGSAVHLSEMVARSPTLVAFFKQSCVTSRLTLPFVERLHQHYPALQTLGISQDDAADTQTFIAQTGITFPVLNDSDWKVSAEYDLFTVPSVFLLDTSGKLARANMGWSKENYNALADDIAQLLHAEPITLVTEADKVPPFKPG